MNLLILKLILAPLIIGFTSLVGRRWGPAVSGLLVALPITSGPVIFILSLSHSREFVFDTIRGTLSGGLSLVAYCLTYAWISRKSKWPASILGSLLVFSGVTMLLEKAVTPFAPLILLIVAAIFLGLKLMPRDVPTTPIIPPENWDIPARILVGTGFLLLLTGMAPAIGPRLTGLLTTIPLYISILAVFAHHQQGHAAANSVLRGLLLGLFSFTGFYLALGIIMAGGNNRALAFGTAILTALAVQGVSVLVLNTTTRNV